MITDRGYIFYDVTQIKRLPVNGGQPKYNSGATSGNLSNNNIPLNSNVVNSQDMHKSGKKFSYSATDSDYLAAVENGDTDAVTYDNNGDIIPLSERFKDDNSDIRFSYQQNKPNKSLTNKSVKSYNKKQKNPSS